MPTYHVTVAHEEAIDYIVEAESAEEAKKLYFKGKEIERETMRMEVVSVAELKEKPEG